MALISLRGVKESVVWQAEAVAQAVLEEPIPGQVVHRPRVTPAAPAARNLSAWLAAAVQVRARGLTARTPPGAPVGPPRLVAATAEPAVAEWGTERQARSRAVAVAAQGLERTLPQEPRARWS